MRNIALTISLASLLGITSAGAAPREGDLLPDVSAFDELGKAFPLRGKLEGKPAVIVFGCLT